MARKNTTSIRIEKRKRGRGSGGKKRMACRLGCITPGAALALLSKFGKDYLAPQRSRIQVRATIPRLFWGEEKGRNRKRRWKGGGGGRGPNSSTIGKTIPKFVALEIKASKTTPLPGFQDKWKLTSKRVRRTPRTSSIRENEKMGISGKAGGGTLMAAEETN